MAHGANSFEDSTVQQLRDSIVLRGVMGGEAVFGPLGLKKIRELAAGILPTAVRPQPLDPYSMLSLSPLCESLVSCKGFVLGS
jgi:hypothetical protein